MAIAADVSAKPPLTLQRWMDYLGIPVALLVFAILYLMPTPAGLTARGQMTLAIFLMALVLWVTQSIPTYATALVSMVLLVLTGAWTEKAVLGVFGQDVIWLMVTAFILTSAMTKTQLARRVALLMVASFSSRAWSALLTMIVLNGLLAFLVPSTTARAALMLPIVLILADMFGAVKGKSNFGASLMMQSLFTNSIFTSGILTATAANIMAVGFIQQLGGQEVFYTDWLFASFPIAVITCLLTWLLGLYMYPPEYETPQGKGVEDLRAEYKRMGPVSMLEWKAAFIFLLTVFLWVSDRWQVQMWGFTISTAMAAVIGATLIFLPGIGILKWKEASIPWDLMIFSCGAYSVGLALENSGAAQWLMNSVFNSTGIRHMSFFSAYAIVIVIAMFSHLIFTSKTVRTAIIIPVVISLAKAMGVSPMSLALPAAFTMTWTITLPPHSKPNLIFYGTGYFSISQELVYGLLVCAIGSVLLIAAGPTWFTFLGLMK